MGIGFGHANARLVCALAALLTFPIGLVSASLQLAAILAVLLAAVLIRPRPAMVPS
jgi:hypothetical protein